VKKTYNILSSGKLSRHDNTILYESSSGEKKFIPIETVDEINIFGEVSLNTKFIDFISRYDIVVHFYNYYGFYVGSLVPRKKNVSGFLVVEQAKRYINIEERLYLAKAFVEGAMHNMARNLSEYNESREERQEIQKIREQLYEAMTIEEVMSFEGAARKQ
jgi:CRISPR-associated protein Cas1